MADYVLSVSSAPIKNGIVTVDDTGTVVDVSSGSEQQVDVEKYEGVIVPGFVNAHCHLELSHMKGQINEKKGLPGFISEIVVKRNEFAESDIKAAIEKADEEMFRNGIVAVGDISNTDHSFEQKKKSKIAYHTFLEIFDLIPEQASAKIMEANALVSKLGNLKYSLVPHAPYSVSSKLIEEIDCIKQDVISIHNQESATEIELFESATGPLAEIMEKSGVDVRVLSKAKSPLLYVLGRVLESKLVLLVHNTFTTKADLQLIKSYLLGAEYEVAFCFCPRANTYIENRIPTIPIFIESGMKIAVGTDSYASNWSLSILEELKTISKQYPEISFETLLKWATINGAEVLGMGKTIGTIEVGKTPGLNLIKGLGSEKFELNERAEVQRLV